MMMSSNSDSSRSSTPIEDEQQQLHNNTPTVSPRTVHFQSERGTAASSSAHSFPKSISRRSTSASIPIDPNSVLQRSLSDHQLHASEAEADLKDYQFYNRVVQGIIKSKADARDTQQCLENIVRARHDNEYPEYLRRHPEEQLVLPSKESGYYYASQHHTDRDGGAAHFYAQEALKVSETVQAVNFGDDDGEEEGVFDLEL